MAAELQLTLRVDENSPDNINSNSGALYLTDQTLICALGQESNPPVARWFRSTDHGTTWSEVGSSLGGLHNNPSFGCHFPTNVAVAPTAELDFATGGIVRSTDKGSTWTEVLSRVGPTTPTIIHSTFSLSRTVLSIGPMPKSTISTTVFRRPVQTSV